MFVFIERTKEEQGGFMNDSLVNFEYYEPTCRTPVPAEMQHDALFKKYMEEEFERDPDGRFLTTQIDHMDRILGQGFMDKLKSVNPSDYYKALSFGLHMTRKKENWSSLFAGNSLKSNCLDVYGNPKLTPAGVSMTNSDFISFFYESCYQALSDKEKRYINFIFKHPKKPVIEKSSPTMWVDSYMCGFDTQFDSSLLGFRRLLCELHDEQFLPGHNLDEALQANRDFLKVSLVAGQSQYGYEFDESIFCQLIRKGYIRTAIKQAESHINLNIAAYEALHPEVYIAYAKYYDQLSSGIKIDFKIMLADLFDVKPSGIPNEIEDYANTMLQLFIGSSFPSIEQKSIYELYHDTAFSRLIFGVLIFGDKKYHQKVKLGYTGEKNREKPIYSYLIRNLSKGQIPQESIWSMYAKRYSYVFNAISPYFSLKEGIESHLSVKNKNWEDRIWFYKKFLGMTMLNSQLVVNHMLDAVSIKFASKFTLITTKEPLYA
ncbi:hypothetical protein L5176_004267 [Vibrio parahaemolyticus]|nr:hypothetical protein [Vibrio parahaemolyticus]